MGYKDIELTVEEIAYIEQFKTFGEQWKEKSKDSKKASKWIEEHCEKDEEHTWSKNRGRCYNVGNVRWVTKDRSPLTDDDIEAIKTRCYGQENRFTVSEDRMHIDHYWECDSSD